MVARKCDRKVSEDRVLKYVAAAMCAIGLISLGLGVKALVETGANGVWSKALSRRGRRERERGSGKNRTWALVVAYQDSFGLR